MRRSLLAALAATVALSCERAPEERSARETARAETPERASVDVFAEQPPAGARVVIVGDDSAVVPAGVRGAVFVPLSTFSVERNGIPNEFPPADSMANLLERAGAVGDRIVIVGKPIPAGRAYAALDYLGFGDRAALLDGGLAALPPASGDTMETPAAGELAVDVRDDMIVNAEWVHERLNRPGVAILDARPPDEYSGAKPGEGVGRPGHIPGARNLFWQTLVRSPDDSRLRDEAELRQLFDAAGAAAGDTVIAYCRTGGQASFLYTVARHLGYEVRLYDGSFIDWSRTDYPVER